MNMILPMALIGAFYVGRWFADPNDEPNLNLLMGVAFIGMWAMAVIKYGDYKDD